MQRLIEKNVKKKNRNKIKQTMMNTRTARTTQNEPNANRGSFRSVDTKIELRYCLIRRTRLPEVPSWSFLKPKLSVSVSDYQVLI